MSFIEWWPAPKNEMEIDNYLDKLFMHSGSNLWTKLLKPAVKKDLMDRLNKGSVLR